MCVGAGVGVGIGVGGGVDVGGATEPPPLSPPPLPPQPLTTAMKRVRSKVARVILRTLNMRRASFLLLAVNSNKCSKCDQSHRYEMRRSMIFAVRLA